MEVIKELRKTRGITQAELCAALKIAQPTLSGYEKGLHEPDTETLIKLADFFDVSVDYLLGRDKTAQTEKAAGAVVPNDTPTTSKEDELLYIFRGLIPDLQDALLNIAHTLAGQGGQREQPYKTDLQKKA